MLVLTRRPLQSICIGQDIEIVVLSVDGGNVRLGIEAPRHVVVNRTEIYAEIAARPEHGNHQERTGPQQKAST